jgi:hypothetical protein
VYLAALLSTEEIAASKLVSAKTIAATSEASCASSLRPDAAKRSDLPASSSW